MTERFFNLVVPLVQGELPFTTAMRTTDTTEAAVPPRAWSGAVTQLGLFRPGDVDSTIGRSTPATTTTPGPRTSATASRTTTTRATSFGLFSSADQAAPNPADFSFFDLVRAHGDCSRTKRNKPSALAFECNLERNLIHLFDELQEGTYTPGPSICFVITRPKPREVWAAQFRDRIVQHLLYNKIADRFHTRFIADSCACIPGRGTLYGAERLEAKIRSITQNWSRPAFYLKLDLANFFVSINKHILRELLARYITEPWWMHLTDTLLFHDPRIGAKVHSSPAMLAKIPPHKSLFNQPADQGLPIGNLLSQFAANVYLNVLDQHCKQELRARYYIRYVDDFILLHEDPHWLSAAHAHLAEWLPGRLAVRLNESKTILQPIPRGVDFVGQEIKPWRRTTRQHTRNVALKRATTAPLSELFTTANSYFGLLRQASHGHQDCAQLANILRRRGHTINGGITKTYRRSKSA